MKLIEEDKQKWPLHSVSSIGKVTLRFTDSN